jgi:hypothetical protein
MPFVDEELKAFLESGVASDLATRNAQLVPELAPSWGPRVLPGGDSMEIFIVESHAGRSIDNLRENGEIAVAFAEPISHRSVQLKGKVVEIGQPAPADWPWIDRHQRSFLSTLRTMGYSEQFTNNLWRGDVVKVRFDIKQAFNQTPGPGAGGAL